MGQFDRFIEPAGTSPRAMRAVQVLLPAAWIAEAVHTPTAGHIALATGFAVLFLPAGVAPRRSRAFTTRLDAHLVLSSLLMSAVLTAILFGLLTDVLHPLPSLGIAAAAMSVYFVVLLVLGRRRNRRTVVAR